MILFYPLRILDINWSPKKYISLIVMNWIQFFISKLVGHDINSKQNELEQSISALEKENSYLEHLLDQQQLNLRKSERENSDLSNCVNKLEAALIKEKEENKTLSRELNASQSIIEEENSA